MKKILAAVLTAVMFCLSSCLYSGGSVDSLLHPPRLNDEQNDIWLALKRTIQSDTIKLVYPLRGENRSAIILQNLDGEPSEEAVVFYQPSSSSTASTPIRMNILDKVDGQWQSMHDIVLEGTQVEDVTILNVGTGVPLLALGLSYAGDGGNSLLKVIGFDGSLLSTLFSQYCQAKIIGDLTVGGTDDCLLIQSRGEEEGLGSRAVFFQWEDGTYTEQAFTILNPEVTRYGNLYDGYLRNGTRAVYLDCYKGTELMTTEILSLQVSQSGAELENLTYDSETMTSVGIDRPAGISCYDLSRDGVIEIPGQRLMPGYEEGETGAIYLTDWYHYADGEFVRQLSAYVSSSLGYLLQFPEKWVNHVSVRRTTQQNEILFYEHQRGSDPVKNELLYLKVDSRRNWEQKEANSDYELIDTRGQLVYLAKIPKTDSPLRITIAQVKEYFSQMI
ncbi:MAG: hypothetical protein PUC47_03195 [Oscillospiraceae bacterium]|nr:hypothetical protein [Oscillospiraceae bacterium]